MGSRDSGDTKGNSHWVQDPPLYFNGPCHGPTIHLKGSCQLYCRAMVGSIEGPRRALDPMRVNAKFLTNIFCSKFCGSTFFSDRNNFGSRFYRIKNLSLFSLGKVNLLFFSRLSVSRLLSVICYGFLHTL